MAVEYGRTALTGAPGRLPYLESVKRDGPQEITVFDHQADRCIFAPSSDEWDQLSAILDRPARRDPRLATLLAEPSVLERRG